MSKEIKVIIIAGARPNFMKVAPIIKCIRTVLEGYLRFKFVRKLKKGEWLGNALTKIRDADAKSPFWRLQAFRCSPKTPGAVPQLVWLPPSRAPSFAASPLLQSSLAA